MIRGYAMNNGFKEVEISEVIVYGRKEWKFSFLVGGTVYNERMSDDKARYIKVLEDEYYFEEDENSLDI